MPAPLSRDLRERMYLMVIQAWVLKAISGPEEARSRTYFAVVIPVANSAQPAHAYGISTKAASECSRRESSGTPHECTPRPCSCHDARLEVRHG
jgi:hypothetical protein